MERSVGTVMPDCVGFDIKIALFDFYGENVELYVDGQILFSGIASTTQSDTGLVELIEMRVCKESEFLVIFDGKRAFEGSPIEEDTKIVYIEPNDPPFVTASDFPVLLLD